MHATNRREFLSAAAAVLAASSVPLTLPSPARGEDGNPGVRAG